MYSLVEIAILNAIAAGALAAVVLLFSRLLRRPALLHALWILVLLKLVTPPIIEVPVGLKLERLAALTEAGRREQAIPDNSPSPIVATGSRAVATPASADRTASDESLHEQSLVQAPPATIEARPVDLAYAAPMSTKLRTWIATAIPVALWIWILGALAWFFIQSWRIAGFARLASTTRLASEEIQQQAAQLGASIGVRRAPRIWVLDATISPILWSIGSRARIIFPAALLDRVNQDARATLLTHELAHYHRGDHWVRLLEFVVTGLFWWHPAVWVARREIEVSEEHCCDAWVVAQFPGASRRYAEALLDTIDFLSEGRPRLAPVSTGLGQVPFLRERIRLIMSGVAPKAMSGATRLAMLAIAAVLLPLGPQLFDGAIRRADAALDKLDSNSVSALTLASLPVDPDTDMVESEDAGTVPSQQVIDLAEESLIGESAAGVAAWANVNSPDGRFQAVARVDGGLVLRDTFHQRSFDLGEYQISSIAFAPHRDLLAAGSSDSKVYLFDCASGEPVTTFAGHKAPVASVAVSLDGQYVVSGSRDGAVKLWDIDYEREVPSRIPAQSSPVNCVRFSPDGRLLAIASGDWLTSDAGSVLLWDLRGGTTKRRFESSSPVGAIALRASQLIAAQWNGQTTTWDLLAGTGVPSATIDKDTVSAAAFAADSQSMLLTAADGNQASSATPVWFQRMDRDGDGRLAWNEFQGPRGTFRKLDADADEIVTRDEIGASIQ